MELKKIKKKKVSGAWLVVAGGLTLALCFFILGAGAEIKLPVLPTRSEEKNASELLEEENLSGDAEVFDTPETNSELREGILKFVRRVVDGFYGAEEVEAPSFLKREGGWRIKTTLYLEGKIVARRELTKTGEISSVLRQAVLDALKDSNLSSSEAEAARFLIEIGGLRGETFSLLEYAGEAYEVKGGVVPVRVLTKKLIKEEIESGKDYLYRVIHPEKGGVYKYYYPEEDEFDNRLRTTYTATLLYSLLKADELEKDEQIEKVIRDAGEFIFFMQEEELKKAKGAFHYSFNLEDGRKDDKFVVGTNSKTIYTLLKLYERTGDEKYLRSARGSADWLLEMQEPNGKMKSYVRRRDNKWFYSTKYSVLYNGEVLSALSRMYRATGEERYLEGAEKIALNFQNMVETEGCYVGDDYRNKNPISSAWVVMSLLDYYRASGEKEYREIVFECSDALLKRQFTDKEEILYYGRWPGAYSTSGNGWMCEVFSEVHDFCLEQGRERCSDYKKAVALAARWIMERTYDPVNSYFFKNEKALGGAFWNRSDNYVRTDSVAHALNGYVNTFPHFTSAEILSLPESSFGALLESTD